MKRSYIKVMSILACTMITASIFSGCKPKEVEQNNAVSNEPVKLKIMNRLNPDVKLEDNNLLKEIEKAANVKIEYDAPPINNYVDRLQIVMASGDLPDIIYNWGGADANYDKWAKDGLLADITDKVSKYPNLSQNISKEMWEAMRATTTGKIHSVPKPNVKNYWGYMINDQWLKKLNLKAPTTVNEFTEVCRAFSTQDPDGNGKQDTYGVSSVGPMGMQFLMSAFDLTPSLGAKDVDGNYKIMQKFQGYIPYLTYLKKLYAEKLLDPEFFTNKIYADQDKQLAERVGISYGHQVVVLGAIIKKADVVEKFSYYGPLKNESGEAKAYIGAPIWGTWMISASTKNLDGALKFLDWGNSKEGFTLMNMGIKGTHYNEYDFDKRTVTRTAEQSTLLKTVSSSYLTTAFAYNGSAAIVENGDTPERINKYNKDFEAMKKVTKVVDLPAVKAPKLQNIATSNPDDVKKKDEMEIKYITGEITVDQFKDYLEKQYFPKVADAEKEYIEFMKTIK